MMRQAPELQGWLVGLLILVAGMGTAASRAGDETPITDLALEQKGLKAVGPLYVLGGEAEARKKLAEVRQLSRQLNALLLQQASFGTPQDHQAYVQGLTAQINQMKNEIQTVNQQIARLPRYRNRLANNYVQQEHADLSAYANELRIEMNQQNQLLGQVKAHPPDPKMKQKVDADVNARRADYAQAVQDLSQLAHATKDRYADLAKDEDVKRALKGLELKVKPSPKLGPSHEFHELLKVVEKIERDPGEPKAKAKAKTSRSSRHIAP